MLPPAHVLTGSGVPWWADVAAYAVAIAGAVAALAAHARRPRNAGLAAVALGFGSWIVLGAALPGAPAAPTYRLSLATPQDNTTTTTPVLVRVCGRWPSGLSATVPDSGRVISVAVDDTERASTTASIVAVDVPQGRHRIRVEVLTPDHHVFQPRLSIEHTVTVTGSGPLDTAAQCSGATPPP